MMLDMWAIGLLEAGKGSGTIVLLLSVALLMFVWLRSIRRRGGTSSQHASCLKARVFVARAEISQIDAANWLRKHNSATRILRRSVFLTTEQLAWLKSLSASQAPTGAD